MKKEQIEKYIEKEQKISDRNYMTYQETGTSRYLRAYEQAEERIEIARQALSAADDHAAVGRMKADIVDICSQAIRALHNDADVLGILKNIKIIGKSYGVADPWEGANG